MKKQTMWAVDLPNPYNISGPWINIDYFANRKTAIKYVCDNMGLNKNKASVFVSKVAE
jgi:hypothetical protein